MRPYDPARKWAYLEANTVCSGCGAILDGLVAEQLFGHCPLSEPISGGPGYVVTMTEAEIFDLFFDHWSVQMQRIGKASEISKEACIEDFIIVNWAQEVSG